MKKVLLPLIFILGMLSFTGCEMGTGGTPPYTEEVTVDDFDTAYRAAEDIIISSVMDSITSLIPKVIFAVMTGDNSPFSHSITLDDIALENDMYSSISGELTFIYSGSTGCEFIMDLEFTGNGMVKTIYAEASFDIDNFDGSVSRIEINGQDLGSDFSSLLTTLLISEITSLITDLF